MKNFMKYIALTLSLVCGIIQCSHKDPLHGILQHHNGLIGIFACKLSEPAKAVHASPHAFFTLGNMQNFVLISYIFDAIQNNHLSLDRHIPLASHGSSTSICVPESQTIKKLMKHTLQKADMRARDTLLNLSGGWKDINGWLQQHNIKGIRCNDEPYNNIPFVKIEDTDLYPELSLPNEQDDGTPDATPNNSTTPCDMLSFFIKTLKGNIPGMQTAKHQQLLKKWLKESDRYYTYNVHDAAGFKRISFKELPNNCSLATSIFVKGPTSNITDPNACISHIEDAIYDKLLNS